MDKAGRSMGPQGLESGMGPRDTALAPRRGIRMHGGWPSGHPYINIWNIPIMVNVNSNSAFNQPG